MLLCGARKRETLHFVTFRLVTMSIECLNVSNKKTFTYSFQLDVSFYRFEIAPLSTRHFCLFWREFNKLIDWVSERSNDDEFTYSTDQILILLPNRNIKRKLFIFAVIDVFQAHRR